ncbi:MAG: DNA polymerase III subunit gamma/tau [Candidatus Aminicenantes bacterium]|nr:DNA polymerase III subunit gamma/tau [Candidatus Aminicenantes bacterium]
MQYLVYARKYRPKTFEEMIGQKAVVRTLQNALANNRIAQAYIFSGMRGVGKTTAARILAKALNCEKGPTPTPCNVCESCREIDEDRSLDVLEIDGASTRGIDDIRSLRDSVRYKAMHSRTKVIYIDEFHQITGPAFQALLKTLEEPPPQTVFIFATTEFHKVPATIVSRCQHFEFKRVSHREIVNHLNVIAGKEGLTVTPYGLGLIAEASEGSIRDAQSLLDQAVAFCGETIGDAEIKEILGVVSRDLLFAFSAAVQDGRADLVFGLTEKAVEAGHDLRFFYKELVQHFRNLLLVRTVEAAQDLLLVAAEDMVRLKAEAEKAPPEEWLRRLQALQAAEGGLKFASHPQIYFETVMVRLCHFRRLVAVQDILREIEILKAGSGDGGTGPRRNPAADSPRPAPRMTPIPTATIRTGPAPAGPRPEPPAPRAIPAAEPRPPARTAEPAAPAPGRDSDREAALKDPSLRLFMDKFKARIVSVDNKPKLPDEET